MKPTKLKERFENAVEAFFDNDKIGENTALQFADNAAIFQIEESENFAKKNRTLVNILKQIFLFFPGTFFTFYSWMGWTIFGFSNLPVQLCALLISPILMLSGIGNIKNKKHWLIPLSVIILGSLIGTTMSNIPVLREIILNFGNAILFFPVALITAVLVRNWIWGEQK